MEGNAFEAWTSQVAVLPQPRSTLTKEHTNTRSKGSFTSNQSGLFPSSIFAALAELVMTMPSHWLLTGGGCLLSCLHTNKHTIAQRL